MHDQTLSNPTTIALTIFEQIWGTHLHGAINLTGGRCVILHSDNYDIPQTDPDEKGYIDLSNSLTWVPNVAAKRMKFIITLQPDDTYTVFLWQGSTPDQLVKTGIVGKVIDRLDNVYFDQLIDIVDDMYVRYLKEYEGGGFPI